MIKVTTNISETTVKIGKWISRLHSGDRKLLFSSAANAVAILVRSHLSKLASWKHQTAERLGAQPTDFFGKASTRTSPNATENGGEVVIAAPLGRAFHDVEIRPKNAAALTIPASAEAYGKSASILAAHGWKIWKPKGKKFLMGSANGEDPKILYWLTASVKQKQDRSLLPSDEDIHRVAAEAMVAVIRMRMRAAS